jgi:hypothetical protein
MADCVEKSFHTGHQNSAGGYGLDYLIDIENAVIVDVLQDVIGRSQFPVLRQQSGMSAIVA